MGSSNVRPFVGVPIGLAPNELASPLNGRVAFVDTDGMSGDWAGTCKTLSALPGVAVPPGPSDLFGRGIQALFRNVLAGRDVQNGIAALVDDVTFLRACRRLTDTIYGAALAQHGASRIVDASATNSAVLEIIRAVYPEATIIRRPSDATALIEAWSTSVKDFAPSGPEVLHRSGASDVAAPVFVVGVPRSGTTWLQNMLLAHPDLAGPANETSLFVSLRALRDNARRSPADGITGWIELPQLLEAMRAFAASLFADWLGRNDAAAKRIVEKTPLHAEHLPLIGELFPDAAVIAVHRDGRDVVRSLLEMESATDDVVVAATAWTDITRCVSDTLGAVSRGRDERYEALLADPVGAVADLLRWLDLEVSDSVVDEIRRRAAERVSQYNTTGDVGAGKWKSLTKRQLREVHRHAGDRLVELGYATPDEVVMFSTGLSSKTSQLRRRIATAWWRR